MLGDGSPAPGVTYEPLARPGTKHCTLLHCKHKLRKVHKGSHLETHIRLAYILQLYKEGPAEP